MIEQKVLEDIENWDSETGDLEWSDSRFDRLAKGVFRYQYRSNPEYRDYCDRQGKNPETVRNYTDIPAVSTDIFKFTDLSVCSPDSAARIFRTSGTTQKHRGRHIFETLRIYRASLEGPFRRFVLADFESQLGGEGVPFICLIPKTSILPDSSLSFMVSEVVDQWGVEAFDPYFVDVKDETDEWVLEHDRLQKVLEHLRKRNSKTVILGTAFAIYEFVDQLDKSLELPEGSVLMETGGFKGRTRELTHDQLYDAIQNCLGIEKTHIVSEYSMTELSSQAYTANLRKAVESKTIKLNGLGQKDGFVTPPWARVELIDPETNNFVGSKGAEGFIRWYDLANINSVVPIQTSDVGRRLENGTFELLGRHEGAELRGCSLTVEEILNEGNG